MNEHSISCRFNQLDPDLLRGGRLRAVYVIGLSNSLTKAVALSHQATRRYLEEQKVNILVRYVLEHVQALGVDDQWGLNMKAAGNLLRGVSIILHEQRSLLLKDLEALSTKFWRVVQPRKVSHNKVAT